MSHNAPLFYSFASISQGARILNVTRKRQRKTSATALFSRIPIWDALEILILIFHRFHRRSQMAFAGNVLSLACPRDAPEPPRCFFLWNLAADLLVQRFVSSRSLPRLPLRYNCHNNEHKICLSRWNGHLERKKQCFLADLCFTSCNGR